MMVSELLFGETVELIARVGDRWQVRAHLDGYEGFVGADALAEPGAATTHRISVRATLRFPRADIKGTPVMRLPLGAQVSVDSKIEPNDEGLVPIRGGGFVHRDHLALVTGRESFTLAEAACRFYQDAPYLWGGRTPDGCDCSGLVQSVAGLIGRALPRDSGPQEAAIAQTVSGPVRQPDDLVFWPGHVAIVLPDQAVIHANAHTLSVAIEPLSHVIERAGAPSSFKRLPPVGPAR